MRMHAEHACSEQESDEHRWTAIEIVDIHDGLSWFDSATVSLTVIDSNHRIRCLLDTEFSVLVICYSVADAVIACVQARRTTPARVLLPYTTYVSWHSLPLD